MLLIIFLSVFGVSVYRFTKGLLENGDNAAKLSSLFGFEVNRTTPSPTEALQPASTATPTVTPGPTPFVDPDFDSPYLADFEDFRSPLVNLKKAGFDCSRYTEERPFRVKGAYAAHMSNRCYDTVTWLAGFTELNAVIIDVRDDNGYITYDMDCETAKELGIIAPSGSAYFFEDMPSLLEDLHKRGIYCIARIVCFKDDILSESKIAEKHPDWILKKDTGEFYTDGYNYVWLNFYKKDVMKFIADIAVRAAKDGFDEICFDYMRMPAGVASVNFDYGCEEEAVPSRTEQIAKFTKYACNRLKPLGVYVSGCVYGITIDSDLDSANLGQDYKELSKYLDFICPMVYPSHYSRNFRGIENVNGHPYELILLEMKNSEKKLEAVREANGGYSAVCRPWLQAFSYDFTDVRKQVDACYDAGVKTWMFWNSRTEYEQEYFLTKEEENF